MAYKLNKRRTKEEFWGKYTIFCINAYLENMIVLGDMNELLMRQESRK